MWYNNNQSNLASLLKAIRWRICAMLSTITIGYVVTRKLTNAITIRLIESVVKAALYYFPEPVWMIIGDKKRRLFIRLDNNHRIQIYASNIIIME
jgi:uncharacterized membrane protein